MNAGEDDDIKLQRSSALLLADITKLLPRLLRKKSHDSRDEVRHLVKEMDMNRLFVMVYSPVEQASRYA